MIKWDDAVEEILGRPNFQCAGIASVLRKKGFEIDTRSESEQANVLYWMLPMYEEHGSDWRMECEKFLKVKDN